MPAYNEFWLSDTHGPGGLGTVDDPFRCGDNDEKFAAANFDNKMRVLAAAPYGPNLTIHLFPGIYRTFGFSSTIWENPPDPASQPWRPLDGWRIIGAGMGSTTIKLVDDNDPARWDNHVIGRYYNQTTHFAEVIDLTLDVNLQSRLDRSLQPNNNVGGAAALSGNFCKIRRVRAINWGTENVIIPNVPKNTECFVMYIGTHPEIGDYLGSAIEECIVTQPAAQGTRDIVHRDGTSAITIAGGQSDPGVYAFNRACRIAHNFVYEVTTCGSEPNPLPGQPVYFNSYGLTGNFGGGIFHNQIRNVGGPAGHGIYSDTGPSRESVFLGNVFLDVTNPMRFLFSGWDRYAAFGNLLATQNHEEAVGIEFPGGPPYGASKPVLGRNFVRSFLSGANPAIKGLIFGTSYDITLFDNLIDAPDPANAVVTDAVSTFGPAVGDRTPTGSLGSPSDFQDLLEFAPGYPSIVLETDIQLSALPRAQQSFEVLAKVPDKKIALPDLASSSALFTKAWPGCRLVVRNVSIVNKFILTNTAGAKLAEVPPGLVIKVLGTAAGWELQFSAERELYESISAAATDSYLTIRAGESVNIAAAVTNLWLPPGYAGWSVLLMNTSTQGVAIKDFNGATLLTLAVNSAAVLTTTDTGWLVKQL